LFHGFASTNTTNYTNYTNKKGSELDQKLICLFSGSDVL